MNNNQCLLINGKGLGGTSSINSMLYTRGNALDYDRWADENLKSWCYDKVLPYFKKSEDVALEHFDNKFHSKGGPLDVENVQYQSPLVKTFLEAGEKIGAEIVDYNGRNQLGFSLVQAMTNHGKRKSTSAAFLEPAAHRKNLKIYTNSHVVSIILGDHTNEAKGVKYVKNGKLYVAKSKKEVILTAGIYNSPQILMQSGIGPHKHLEELGIAPKVNLEGIGQNLQDHQVFLGLNFLINETIALNHHNEHNTEDNLKIWLTEGKGPLTKTQNIEGLGYVKTKASKEDKAYPDVELLFVTQVFDENYAQTYKKLVNLNDETFESVFKPLLGHYVLSIYVVVLHPKSRGKVELKSNNPFDWPKIYSNHFSDPDNHDIETLVEGIKLALKLAKTEPFLALETKLAEVKVPGCEQHEHSHDYWQCCARKLTVSHPQVGTCKMGLKDDKNAVVDEELKVFGVSGLRVADNSVVPNALSAHITAPTIMIGEKAADLIKDTWK